MPALRNAVPKDALATRFRETTVQEIARETLRIARAGLRRRAAINRKNQDETVFLAPLEMAVASGRTVADELLERYSGSWKRRIDHIFAEFAF